MPDLEIARRKDEGETCWDEDGGEGVSGSAVRECRICLESDNAADLVQPCTCTGSVQWAHLECLKKWCSEKMTLKCELCGKVYRSEVVEELMPAMQEAQARFLQQHPGTLTNAYGDGETPNAPDLNTIMRVMDALHLPQSRFNQEVQQQRLEALRRRRQRMIVVSVFLTLFLLTYMIIFFAVGRSISIQNSGIMFLRLCVFIVPVVIVLSLLNVIRRRHAMMMHQEETRRPIGIQIV